MLQSRHGFRLCVEARDLFLGRVVSCAHHLERDGALEVDLKRLVDDAHAAAAQLALEAITGKLRQPTWLGRAFQMLGGCLVGVELGKA